MLFEDTPELEEQIQKMSCDNGYDIENESKLKLKLDPRACELCAHGHKELIKGGTCASCLTGLKRKSKFKKKRGGKK